MKKNTEADFWAQVSPEPTSGCWLWTGAVLHAGHGTVRFNGRYWQAHRLAWTLLRGEIPEGACLCHKCDVPGCVNVDHLYVGSKSSNHGDMVRRGRQARGERQHLAKLTPAAVEEIRIFHRAGAPTRDLAARYGVHPGTITRAANRETWRHI